MAVSTIDALYNGTSEKLTTSATGITVTGTVAATAYTGDGSALTGTGSPSIDDNGVATVITIDSSDRVLTDTTNVSAIAQTGNSMTYDNGRLEVQKYRASALKVGNYTDAFGAFSGDLIGFYSGGATVGSIGATSGDLYIGEGDTGLKFDAEFEAIVPFNTSTLANRDGQIDLGYSNPRFKDLYLSGGVYLGGAVAANKLDDFEEGTWTPTIIGSSSAGTMIYSDRAGRYQKVGRLVTIHFYIQGNSGTGSGNLLVGGLPFTIANYHLAYGSPQWNTGIAYPSGVIDANFTRFNSTSFEIRCNKSSATWASVQYPVSPEYLRGCITYETTE